jgi:polyribonucleotide nucleotidyltransferase
MMAFGIPGDAVTAVMLGALIIHGIQPGPLFVTTNAPIAYGMFAAYFLAHPLTMIVAGIAIGLVKEDGRAAILTDIAGLEDHFGDMDFKVAGTRNGVTGVQLDIKSHGLKHDIMVEALTLSHKCRMHILDQMDKTIAKPPKQPLKNPNRYPLLKEWK